MKIYLVLNTETNLAFDEKAFKNKEQAKKYARIHNHYVKEIEFVEYDYELANLREFITYYELVYHYDKFRNFTVHKKLLSNKESEIELLKDEFLGEFLFIAPDGLEVGKDVHLYQEISSGTKKILRLFLPTNSNEDDIKNYCIELMNTIIAQRQDNMIKPLEVNKRINNY